MIRLAGGLAALSLALGSPANAPDDRMKLGEVLLFSVPDLRPGIDPTAFEPLLATIAATRSEAGVAVNLFRADRGGRKGQYVLVSAIDRLSRRRDRSAVPGFQTKGVEYHLVAPETVGTLPEVEVLGLHYTKVRPDRVEAFERFVSEKLHPAVANLGSDLRILYYKDVRGADAGSYLALFALTSASRDKYWPGGSDSDDLRKAFAPLRELTKELSTYLVDGSYLADPKFAAAVFESREWVDFVLVPTNAR
jgi:hypothetical protein